jgi:hypothetical protein
MADGGTRGRGSGSEDGLDAGPSLGLPTPPSVADTSAPVVSAEPKRPVPTAHVPAVPRPPLRQVLGLSVEPYPSELSATSRACSCTSSVGSLVPRPIWVPWSA